MGHESFETQLYVTFSVIEDQLLRKPKDQASGTQALIYYKNRSTGELVSYHSGSHYRWLLTMYWYSHFPLEPVGASWVANSKFLYLGWYQPSSGEQGGDELTRFGGLREQDARLCGEGSEADLRRKRGQEPILTSDRPVSRTAA